MRYKKIFHLSFPCLLILLMQFCTYPYVFYILVGLPSENIIYIIFFVLILICNLISKSKNTSLPSALKALMVVQSIVWLFYFVIFSDSSYLTRIFFIILTFITINYLNKTQNIFRFTKYYNTVLTIQGVLGIIGFILAFIGILTPLLIHYYSETRYLNWYGITCSNAVVGNFIRVGAFFDEPGAFAFWGLFALIFNKLFFNNKKVEFLLIISLFFTFSAAYFVLIPIYFISFYSSNIKRFLKVLLVMVPLLFIIYNSLSNNLYFQYITTERFQGGEIRSTRYDQSDYTKKIFLKSPTIGIGAKNMDKDKETTDNPYEILAKDGVVGFIISYLPLLFLIVKFRNRKEVIFSVLILFADYMQRPFHINEMHFFTLYLFTCLVILKYRYPNNLKLFIDK